ncbi:myb-binding protein 1A-like protein [Polypterus senegalus]|nr:myb-binding protein 1A-like protein [Polypterus senegalus]
MVRANSMAKVNSDMGEMETKPTRREPSDTKGILKQNREFLDFFWDIAKPDQDTRVTAIENLVRYLRESKKDDELKYTLKRLVEGLAATREASRPGFSLALSQVLQTFEEIPLQTVLDQIKERHNLQKASKKQKRNAAFGNLFGVLALSQSGRLSKEPRVILEAVQLLQALTAFRMHVKDLPQKTIVDILTETPEAVFEEVLFDALQNDLTSAFSTPEQLHLLLVAMQKFPAVLKSKKVKKLLGSSKVVTKENLSKLTEILKTAAKSMKKDNMLPPVARDLMRVAIQEESFEIFWDEVVINKLLKDQAASCSFLCYRLLGSALPLLSLGQIGYVLRGDVLKHYGAHVVSAQVPARFKFAPEMQQYVSSFLETCCDPDKQFAVITGFTCLTNHGNPVVPSMWTVVQNLQPSVVLRYVDWLKDMFCCPKMDQCLDFSTKRQQENFDGKNWSKNCVQRLRQWIIARLASIAENPQVKKEEDLVMGIARFIFFHSFFDTKKPTSKIPETQSQLSVPLDDSTRNVIGSSFFGHLLQLSHLPVIGESPEAASMNERHIHGITSNGSLWISCLVQYANSLLNASVQVHQVRPFTEEQRSAWNRVLESVEDLRKKGNKTHSAETMAFQQLFLLLGINLFKAPEESLDLLEDLHNCLAKSQQKKQKKSAKEDSEPQWVDVLVDILLSLLSQPSRLMRNVANVVFKHICPHVTQRSLNSILQLLQPENINDDEEESAVVVVDEKHSIKKKSAKHKGEEEDEHSENKSTSSEDDSDSDEDEDDALSEEEGEVDENLRLELMNVLMGQSALATEEDKSDEEEVSDEAMMQLDERISALFSEQKKRLQAKKDEKERMRKENTLVRDFKIKVLDLIEIFLMKQQESPLVFGIIEPLLSVIEYSMNSESGKQEQDFLRKTADIFRKKLCRAKRYCKNVSAMKEELHGLMERLLTRAQKLKESFVAAYYFSAVLYLVRVLKGGLCEDSATPAVGKCKKKHTEVKVEVTPSKQAKDLGCLDLTRVLTLFSDALKHFMTKRKSVFTGNMFMDLFIRFPIISGALLDTTMKYITEGVRSHQQGQACSLVLKVLQTREVCQSLTEVAWSDLIEQVLAQVIQCLKSISVFRVKVDHEKVIKCLELTRFLITTIQKQKLSISLTDILPLLQSLDQLQDFHRSLQQSDTYWSVMKLFGIFKPKKEKVRVAEEEQSKQNLQKKKKKGFLPDTKKRKNRKKQTVEEVNMSKLSTEDDKITEEDGKKNIRKQKKSKRKALDEQSATPSKKIKGANDKKHKQKKAKQKPGNTK